MSAVADVACQAVGHAGCTGLGLQDTGPSERPSGKTPGSSETLTFSPHGAASPGPSLSLVFPRQLLRRREHRNGGCLRFSHHLFASSGEEIP